jgi:hypothetical protein
VNKLHFKSWCGGTCGIGNNLMGLQIAVILSYLTKRKLYFYMHPGGNGIHHCSGTQIYDLFECDNIEFVFSDVPSCYKFSVSDDFAYCYNEKPNSEFLNGRKWIDFSEIHHDEICTENELLAYYSYKIFFERERKDALDYMRHVLRPKRHLESLAVQISEVLDCSNAVHLRRGDFLEFTGFILKDLNDYQLKVKKVMSEYFSNEKVLILSNEPDENFFDFLNCEFIFLDKLIEKLFPHLTLCEIAVVSMLVAANVNKFVGTYGSTFSGIIHQIRRLNGISDPFLYIDQFITSRHYSWNELRHPMDFRREFENCGY